MGQAGSHLGNQCPAEYANYCIPYTKWVEKPISLGQGINTCLVDFNFLVQSGSEGVADIIDNLSHLEEETLNLQLFDPGLPYTCLPLDVITQEDQIDYCASFCSSVGHNNGITFQNGMLYTQKEPPELYGDYDPENYTKVRCYCIPEENNEGESCDYIQLDNVWNEDAFTDEFYDTGEGQIIAGTIEIPAIQNSRGTIITIPDSCSSDGCRNTWDDTVGVPEEPEDSTYYHGKATYYDKKLHQLEATKSHLDQSSLQLMSTTLRKYEKEYKSKSKICHSNGDKYNELTLKRSSKKKRSKKKNFCMKNVF